MQKGIILHTDGCTGMVVWSGAVMLSGAVMWSGAVMCSGAVMWSGAVMCSGSVMWSGAVILFVATMKSLLSPPLPSFKTGWQVVRLWTH